MPTRRSARQQCTQHQRSDANECGHSVPPGKRSSAERPEPMATGARPPLPCPRGARCRAPGPVSRGTGRRPAARPAHADIESPTQHGPAADGCNGAGSPEGRSARPLVAVRLGTRGRTRPPYPHRPGVGQSTLGRGTTPVPHCRGQSEVLRVVAGWCCRRPSRPDRSCRQSLSVVAILALAGLAGVR